MLMSVFLSLIETIGITAIMPFITLAADPEKIFNNVYSDQTYKLLDFQNTNSFIIAFGFCLIIFYIFRAIYSVVYATVTSYFTYTRYRDFSFRLFNNYLSLPYKDYVTKNSSILTQSITNEASNLTAFIQSFLLLFAELFTVIFLYIFLLYANFKMTIVLSVLLLIKVFFLTKSISKFVKKQGEKKTKLQTIFFKTLSETFGNFKLIKLRSDNTALLKDFDNVLKELTKTYTRYTTLQQLPKSMLETLGFILLISIILYVVFKDNNPAYILPVISMYALALYRMLPALNRIIGYYSNMIFYSNSLDLVHSELTYSLPVEGSEMIYFENKIELQNITFEYNSEKPIFKDLNLTIYKNDKIAFIGESGSGKSTLVDIIIGIYKPQHGKVLIDGQELTDECVKSWRTKIGYIPQSIYLFDGSVADNVVFGSEYNEEKLIDVLKKANIYSFLQEKEGIETMVGEGGVQLSGGQKQRIGIARALYIEPEILVLDEATSALDNEVESKIMDEIYDIAEDKTLVIIAHRLSTIERCEKQIKIINGQLAWMSC